MIIYDLSIIGSGPAAYTAAIYAIRANLKIILFSGGKYQGGALMKTTKVENFPGFPKGIYGPDLMIKMRQQVENFNVKIVDKEIIKVLLKEKIKVSYTKDNIVYKSKTVIIASGSYNKELGLPNEKNLSGKGISWCATCDAPFYKNKNIAIVGGGDAAISEAIFLSQFAKNIKIIVRKNYLKASKILENKILNIQKIQFIWNFKVIKIHGHSKLKAITIENVLDDKRKSYICIDGLFIAIGSTPRISILNNQLDLDKYNNIKVQFPSSKTSLNGVFACGDIIDRKYRQAITACGYGCIAALDAKDYLNNI